jgi:hypothetical protein
MYGRECIGVTVPGHEIKDAQKCLRGSVMDNMGLDFIVYWPHLKWFPEFDKPEEE